MMNSSEPTSAPFMTEVDLLRARVHELERGQVDRQQAQVAAVESSRLLALSRDVSVALISSSTLQKSLHLCAQALVDHLGAAFARIWTLNTTEQMLELQASAGLYTHLDGPHSRVPVGTLKIGLIASERLPHLTNAVIGDPRVSHQEWAKREGMMAFAGYPLIVDEQLVGVMALFARHILSAAVLDAMASVANGIALGIERKRVDDERSLLLSAEQRARAEAETALQVRNAFLSGISHDLKTPLSSIKGSAQLLQRRLASSQLPDTLHLSEGLRLIESSTRKMAIMIDELLDLALLQSGQALELDFLQVDLVALVSQAVTGLQATTMRHRVQAVMSVSELIGLGDPVRLDRVLTNLLSNAIKYSPDGGQITLTLAKAEAGEHTWAVITVSDQGLGISDADLPYIFDPFRRGEYMTGRIQGTGIGLTSAAQIVKQHGGTIAVVSEEAVGTTFTVRLPLHKVPQSGVGASA
jgi:signal transduction histidine kinase